MTNIETELREHGKSRHLHAAAVLAADKSNIIPTANQKYAWVHQLASDWGRHMRSQPNGWYRENHVANLEKTLLGSGNNRKQAVFVSDQLEFKGNQISVTQASTAAFGELGKNPADGLIRNIRMYGPIIPVRGMSQDQLRFHRAWKRLSECHQAMLWTQYVLNVAQKQRVSLLQTTNDLYPKWLDRSQRTIARQIESLDSVSSSKNFTAGPETGRNTHGAGPLWPCGILASVHKYPIRHSTVKDLLPASFSTQGFRIPRTPADYLPTDRYMFCRRPSGELYTVLSLAKWLQLRKAMKLTKFLHVERNKAPCDGTSDGFCYRSFDYWSR